MTKSALPDPDLPARLFRSRSAWEEELDLFPMEEIGSGSLAKMVRIALSDPDDAIWAYRIVTSDGAYSGKEIAALRNLA
jgi:hypothetical protein